MLPTAFVIKYFIIGFLSGIITFGLDYAYFIKKYPTESLYTQREYKWAAFATSLFVVIFPPMLLMLFCFQYSFGKYGWKIK